MTAAEKALNDNAREALEKAILLGDRSLIAATRRQADACKIGDWAAARAARREIDVVIQGMRYREDGKPYECRYAEDYGEILAQLISEPGVHFLTISHDDWCTMIGGDGSAMCNPIIRDNGVVVSE